MWHCLCRAPLIGWRAAAADMLSCGTDARACMEAVRAMFASTPAASPEATSELAAVIAAAAAAPTSDARDASAYAHFYCGLWLEALCVDGAVAETAATVATYLGYFRTAAEAPSLDFMGKLMVMHARRATRAAGLATAVPR